MSLALLWGIAAVVLVVVEMFTMEFTCLSLAIGCVLGATAGAAGFPPVVQMGAALLGAVAGMGLLAPKLRRRLAPRDTATGLDALPGTEAVVTEAIFPPTQGKVKLDGVVWQASANEEIPAGAIVMVTEVDGACLSVIAQGPLLATRKTPSAELSMEGNRPHPQQDMLSN